MEACVTCGKPVSYLLNRMLCLECANLRIDLRARAAHGAALEAASMQAATWLDHAWRKHERDQT